MSHPLHHGSIGGARGVRRNAANAEGSQARNAGETSPLALAEREFGDNHGYLVEFARQALHGAEHRGIGRHRQHPLTNVSASPGPSKWLAKNSVRMVASKKRWIIFTPRELAW
ncbi:MAG: hypothetical protein U1F68_02365 [Gammaproteobacteria bacterium]